MKTALSALARALATIREAEANGNPQNARDLRYYMQRQGYDIAVSSDARKICRAFDAADERDSTEIGIYEVDINNDAEVEANARLIAAAPDLLEALNKINDVLYSVGAPLGSAAYFKVRQICVDALLKAEGREP